LLIVNGILAVGLWVVPAIEPDEAGDLAENVGIFMQLMAWFPAFSVIIITQGALVGEKESGTAAWILSAPVSRSAFILSKLAGNAFGFLVTIILLQGVVAFVQLTLSEGSLLPLGPFLANLGLLSLYLLFYLSLTLMLGAFSGSRGPVMGVAIGVAIFSMLSLGTQLFGGFLPWLPLILPETLPALIGLIVQGEALPSEWPIPVAVIALYSLLFVALSIRRFSREEF
jgi:ABC-2 type transport system permease protein